MRITVIGGTGQVGAPTAAELEARGHEVVRASRATGVDAYTGRGLDEAIRGADAVVDALHLQTISGRKAVDFFATTAAKVVAATRHSAARHLVTVGIYHASLPEVQGYGYFRGKAAQERAVRESGLPHTMFFSAPWYELAATMVAGSRMGPVAIAPHLPTRPAAAAAIAVRIADVVEGVPLGEVAVAGPDARDLHDLAVAIAEQDGLRVRVLALPLPGTRAFRTGVLIPSDDVPGVGPTFEEWLAARRSPRVRGE